MLGCFDDEGFGKKQPCYNVDGDDDANNVNNDEDYDDTINCKLRIMIMTIIKAVMSK